MFGNLDLHLRRLLGHIPGYEGWRERTVAKLEGWGITDKVIEDGADYVVMSLGVGTVAIVSLHTGGAALNEVIDAAKKVYGGYNTLSKALIYDSDGRTFAVDILNGISEEI